MVIPRRLSARSVQTDAGVATQLIQGGVEVDDACSGVPHQQSPERQSVRCVHCWSQSAQAVSGRIRTKPKVRTFILSGPG